MTLKQATEEVMKARWSEAVKISNGLKKAGVSCRPKVMDAYLQESCDALMKRCEDTASIQKRGVMPATGESERTRLYAAMTSQISWVASEEERKKLEEGLLDMIRCEKYMERIAVRLNAAFHRRKGKKQVLVEKERLAPVFERISCEIEKRNSEKLVGSLPRIPRQGRSESKGIDSARDLGEHVLRNIDRPTNDGGEGHPHEDDPLSIMERIEKNRDDRKKLMDIIGDEARLNRLLERLQSAIGDGNQSAVDDIRKEIQTLNNKIVRGQEALDVSGIEGTEKAKS